MLYSSVKWLVSRVRLKPIDTCFESVTTDVLKWLVSRVRLKLMLHDVVLDAHCGC